MDKLTVPVDDQFLIRCQDNRGLMKPAEVRSDDITRPTRRRLCEDRGQLCMVVGPGQNVRFGDVVCPNKRQIDISSATGRTAYVVESPFMATIASTGKHDDFHFIDDDFNFRGSSDFRQRHTELPLSYWGSLA